MIGIIFPSDVYHRLEKMIGIIFPSDVYHRLEKNNYFMEFIFHKIILLICINNGIKK